jgi:hypothetical protein
MNAKLKPPCGGKFVIHRRDTQSVGILTFGSSVIWPFVYGETDRNHFVGKLLVYQGMYAYILIKSLSSVGYV